MKRKLVQTILLLMVLIAIVIIAVRSFRTKPIAVDIAPVANGPLQVTIDAEGKTRVRDRFTVASPIAGRLTRINLRRGDTVRQGAVIARIDPLPLAPLDIRQYTEANARVAAAEAHKREAEAQVAHLKADLEQAGRERARAEQLARSGDISRQKVEETVNAETTIAKDLEAAQFKSTAAIHEIEAAKSALLLLEQDTHRPERSSIVTAPVSGKVLRVIEESERVITAGTPLIELSNPSKIEIVIDVLSTDAVKVQPGVRVSVDAWGGNKILEARVRLIEPSAFTKVSALGIEEQRVNIIADFVDTAGPLGDGYRVDAHIIIWETDKAFKIPTSALFRHGQNWSVFIVRDGRAYRRNVEIGHRATDEAEVISGLEDSEGVIVHPPNEIDEGVKVEPR